MTTPQPLPVSRQSTTTSNQSFDTRKSVVSVSGINVGSMATLPASVESPEPSPTEEYNPMLNGVKKQLLTAARKCDTNTFVTLLEEWQNLNLNFVDESGKTLLHLCANVGNKNDVILLIHRFCPVNRIDNMGHSALHYSAKKDYADIVELLVVNGALLDLPEEKTGMTALHFAVAKNFIATAEFLVFSGASIQVKDKNNRTPIALCRSKEMHALLSTAIQSSGGTRPGEMTLQTVEVQGGGITQCWKLGLSIDYSSGPADDKFSLMCRRQTTDESDLDFTFGNNEDICSDAFQYRLGRKGKPTPVKITVPIYFGPKPKEEIVLKSEKGHIFPVTSFSKVDTDTPSCVVVVDLGMFQAFILVSRPLTDVFKVPLTGGTFTSTIGTNVGVTVQEDTFSKEVNLVLQTIPPSNSVKCGSDGVKDILTTTPFICLKPESKDIPSKPVRVCLPTPDKFGAGKELKLFSADVAEVAAITDSGWSVRDDPLTITPEGIMFDNSDRAMKLIIETKPDTDMATLKPQVGLLFRSSMCVEYSVVFIVMTKHDPKNLRFNTIIECNTSDHMDEAKKRWLKEGYFDQKPNDTTCFKGFTRQRHKIIASKNLRPQENEEGFMLIQFHPKRSNYVMFTASVTKNIKNETGSVDIMEYKIKERTPEQLEALGPSRPEESLLMKVHIDFEKKEPKAVPVVQVKEPTSIAEKVKPLETDVPTKTPTPAPVKPAPVQSIATPVPAKPPAAATAASKSPVPARKGVKYVGGKGVDKGFTNDEFLYTVVKELDEEWYKIIVMMGWTFPEVEKVLLEPNRTEQDKIMQFLKEWRDKGRSQDDLGMPNLLTAFAKGGRRDLCTVVSLMMKEWYDDSSTNQQNTFWRWVQKAFKDSDLINPGDYPKPMSDQFLLLLAQALEPNLNIVKHLDLTRQDVERLTKGDSSEELKMLKIFVEGRDGAQSYIVALRKLLDAMITLNIKNGVRWTIVASRQWLDISTEVNTQFTSELQDILESYGTRMDPKPYT